MNITLSEMWRRYNLLFEFKKLMNSKGYVGRDVYILNVQINLLEELINIESKQILNEFLMRKTYYRLLQSIDKGIEILPDILEHPENYVLNPIKEDKEAWVDNNVLIFSCKSGSAVFSRKDRKSDGQHYIDNRFQ